jgi:hypothetical protein
MPARVPLNSTVRRLVSVSTKHPGIATANVEEGLDFACNLLVAAFEAAAASGSRLAQETLGSLARYLRFRYVGELALAFEELSALSRDLAPHIRNATQLDDQLTWIEKSLQVASPNTSLERTRER